MSDPLECLDAFLTENAALRAKLERVEQRHRTELEIAQAERDEWRRQYAQAVFERDDAVKALALAERDRDTMREDAEKWRAVRTPNGNEAAQRELAQFAKLLKKISDAERERDEARRQLAGAPPATR